MTIGDGALVAGTALLDCGAELTLDDELLEPPEAAAALVVADCRVEAPASARLALRMTTMITAATAMACERRRSRRTPRSRSAAVRRRCGGWLGFLDSATSPGWGATLIAA